MVLKNINKLASNFKFLFSKNSVLIGILVQIRLDRRRYLDGRRRIGNTAAAQHWLRLLLAVLVAGQPAQVLQRRAIAHQRPDQDDFRVHLPAIVQPKLVNTTKKYTHKNELFIYLFIYLSDAVKRPSARKKDERC
jgi:hypothetical protein